MREVRAFLLAPLPAAILGAIVYKASGDFTRFVAIAIVYLLVLYAVQLLFGLAVRAFLLRTGRRAAFHFAIGGTVMTGIPSLPFLAWDVARNAMLWSAATGVLVIWLMLGTVTGLAYGWLALALVDPLATGS